MTFTKRALHIAPKMFASITDTVNSIIYRFGQAIANGIAYCISKIFQAFQWLAELILSFIMGIFSYVLGQMPGFTSEEAEAIALTVRSEIAKWNAIIPVYEALLCMNAILTFKILVMAKRRYFTTIQHAANLAELKGKTKVKSS